MPEIVDFVKRGSAQITPAVVEVLLRKLPMWRAEFTQIHAPRFPHLAAQLEFLANALEDAAEGAYKDLPYGAIAGAAFALAYAHQKVDLIPDTNQEYGRADDSGVVRAVLIHHEKALAKYAASRGMDWQRISSKP